MCLLYGIIENYYFLQHASVLSRQGERENCRGEYKNSAAVGSSTTVISRQRLGKVFRCLTEVLHDQTIFGILTLPVMLLQLLINDMYSRTSL